MKYEYSNEGAVVVAEIRAMSESIWTIDTVRSIGIPPSLPIRRNVDLI